MIELTDVILDLFICITLIILICTNLSLSKQLAILSLKLEQFCIVSQLKTNMRSQEQATKDLSSIYTNATT